MTMKLRNVPFSPPDMSEAEANMAVEAIKSGWITTGPKTKEFERRIAGYCNTQKAVCLNSATAAMEMVLHLLDLKPDDEVIVPAYTYTASASVTQHVGCKVVMVDSQEDNVEMDYDKLEEAINEHTKLIVPVDLGGIVCDYDRIYSIVESKKSLFKPSNGLQKAIGRIVVGADCAHAFGAKWHGKKAGEIADFSSFSFHAVKNLTTAEGGALTWHLPFGGDAVPVDVDYMPNVPKKEGETWDEMLYRISQLFSLHGQNKDALAKTKLGAWEYDIIGPWYKCNMTDIMAGIGLAQLDRYDGLLERRREIVCRYEAGLSGCPVQVLNHRGHGYCSPSEALGAGAADFSSDCPTDAANSSHHLFLVRLTGRTREETNRVIEQMAERGVACNVHYKPLPMMTAYQALGFDIANYPHAFHLFENEITLPLHTRLSDDDIEYVIESLREVIGE